MKKRLQSWRHKAVPEPTVSCYLDGALRLFGGTWQQPAAMQTQPMPMTVDSVSAIVGASPAPMGMAPAPVEAIVAIQPQAERRGVFRHSPPRDLSPSPLPIEMFDAAELLG
jgi:hypothetical protein